MNFVELPLDFFFQNSASCPWVSALGGVGGQRAEELLIPAGVSSAIDVVVVNLQVIDVEQCGCMFPVHNIICINEYMATGSGGLMCMNSFCAVITEC